MMPQTLVSFSASPHEPSRTTALLDAVVSEFGQRLHLTPRRILLTDIAADLTTALSRQDVGPIAADALAAVEKADLLVVVTPTYRAAYTGMFKHFFDMVDHDALAGTPVFLAAVGGNLSHSLALDQHLRSLFAFFDAVSLPIGVFAENADFVDGAPRPRLRERIATAVDAALPLL